MGFWGKERVLSTVDDFFVNQRNHDEMLAEAKKVHPDMRVRLVGSSEWEMYMPTPYTESNQLAERFRSTHAWVMDESNDASYGSELERFRYKNGYSSYPLEYTAEFVNLKHEQNEWFVAEQEKAYAAEGASDLLDFEAFKDFTNDQYETFLRIREQVQAKMKEVFAEKWAAFKERWSEVE